MGETEGGGDTHIGTLLSAYFSVNLKLLPKKAYEFTKKYFSELPINSFIVKTAIIFF